MCCMVDYGRSILFQNPAIFIDPEFAAAVSRKFCCKKNAASFVFPGKDICRTFVD